MLVSIGTSRSLQKHFVYSTSGMLTICTYVASRVSRRPRLRAIAGLACPCFEEQRLERVDQQRTTMDDTSLLSPITKKHLGTAWPSQLVEVWRAVVRCVPRPTFRLFIAHFHFQFFVLWAMRYKQVCEV